MLWFRRLCHEFIQTQPPYNCFSHFLHINNANPHFLLNCSFKHYLVKWVYTSQKCKGTWSSVYNTKSGIGSINVCLSFTCCGANKRDIRCIRGLFSLYRSCRHHNVCHSVYKRIYTCHMRWTSFLSSLKKIGRQWRTCQLGFSLGECQSNCMVPVCWHRFH